MNEYALAIVHHDLRRTARLQDAAQFSQGQVQIGQMMQDAGTVHEIDRTGFDRQGP
jgi:hypothetical protein